MSRAASLQSVAVACCEALAESQERYSRWTGGVNMRAAPESFVQTMIGEKLYGAGARIRLEAPVSAIRALIGAGTEEVDTDGDARGGRIDVAVYFKGAAKAPRFIVEVKKLPNARGWKADVERIRDLMHHVQAIKGGLLVGYTAALGQAAVDRTIDRAIAPGMTVIQRMLTRKVKTRSGIVRYIGGAVYHVAS